MRVVVLVLLVCLLGCSGLGADKPAETAPGKAGTAPGKADQDVLIFRPSAKGCDWVRWSAASGAKTLGASDVCPEQVLFKPDGSKVVYSVGEKGSKKAVIASWPALATIAELPYPSGVDLDWRLWVTADGVLRLQGDTSAGEPVEEGGSPVWRVGELSASRSKEDPEIPGASAYLIAKYEANRKGEGWTLLSTSISMINVELGMEVFLDAEPGAWPSLAASYASCNSGQSCEKDDWKGRAELAIPEGADTVGFLPAGQGGWLFAVGVGDTPHAQPPVFSCLDPDCKAPVPVASLPKGDFEQLSIQPNGDYALLGVEYSMKGAHIYRLGQGEPVYAAPDAAYAAFIPKGY